MEPWVMWTLGLAVTALPLVLMAAFHGSQTVDSRGRRRSPHWRSGSAAGKGRPAD